MNDTATPPLTDKLDPIPIRTRLHGLTRRRVVIPLIILFLLAVPVGIRWQRLVLVPDVPPPFDVETFTGLTIPDEENAFFYFQQAADLYDNSDVVTRSVVLEQLVSALTKGLESLAWNEVPQELRSWVVEQQPVLQLFRRGARCPQSSYISPGDYRTTTLLPVIQCHRDLTQVAGLDALRLLDEGKTHEAADMLHDAFRATRHMGRRGCVIERLVGIYCHATVVRAWQQWARHPDVTADELEAALQRMREDWKLTPLYSDNLKIQFLMAVHESSPPLTYQRNQIDEALDKQLGSWGGKSASATLNAWLPGWQLPLIYVKGEPDLTYRAAKLWLTHELKTCDLPPSQQPSRAAGFFGLAETPDFPAGLTVTQLNHILGSSYLRDFTGPPGVLYSTVGQEAGREAVLEAEMLLQIAYRRQGVTTRADAEKVLAEFTWPANPASSTGEPLAPKITDAGLEIWSTEIIVIPWPTEKP